MDPATTALISSGISAVVALSVAVYARRTQMSLKEAENRLNDLQDKREEEREMRREARRQRTELSLDPPVG